MLALILAFLIAFFSHTSIVGIPTQGTVVRDDGCTVNPCEAYHSKK